MWSPAVVLACALTLIGRSERSMPPIELVIVAPPEASPRTEAYVRTGERTIYLVTSSDVFRDAAAQMPQRCEANNALRKLASILVHEEWHIMHGPDERGAYEAQLGALLRLNVFPGSSTYASVLRSMQAVVGRKSKRAEMVVARR